LIEGGVVMRAVVRWTGMAVAAGVLLFVVVVGLAWWKSERDMQQVIVIADPSVAELTAAADLTQGRYLYETRGCGTCHGMDGRGQPLDVGPVMTLVASNVTPHGLADRYDADTIVAAIRHGVRHDGRPLLFMPSTDWDEMSDQDAAAIAAYVLALPPIEHDPGQSRVAPLGRVLYLAGIFPLLPAHAIDHQPRARRAPKPGATAQYGFYVAQTCTGCHGVDFAGRQHGPVGTPRASDLRPGGSMTGWGEDDFIRAMREGRRPDDSELHPFMPWQDMGRMADVELSALWRYFETLPRAR
jgi:mono/diheme cytochrome c family protein